MHAQSLFSCPSPSLTPFLSLSSSSLLSSLFPLLSLFLPPSLLHAFANANLMNISALKITKLMSISIKLPTRRQQHQQQQQQPSAATSNAHNNSNNNCGQQITKYSRGRGSGEGVQWPGERVFYGLALLSTCTKYLNFASGATNRSPIPLPSATPPSLPPPTLRC